MHPYLFIYICICFYEYIHIGLAGSVLKNGAGDWDSIPGRVLPKSQKMVLDTSLFNIVSIYGTYYG